MGEFKISLMCLATLLSLNAWAVNTKESQLKKSLINSNEINIRVGLNSFVVTLADNETTKAFKDMLPMTIKMNDLHSNEKYYDLPKTLPTNASKPNLIKAGDLMLYGSNTIVLFYKSFSTTYSYTRLGHVNDPSGLAAALGSGDITLTIGNDRE